MAKRLCIALFSISAKYCMVMPVITVSIYTGRTQKEKDRLAEAITEDVMKILNVAKKDVVIVFQEASHGNWYASGVRL
ncbi:MAG TPA: tautomerase family protein [Nitrososphaeraceae archaeon]|nr:tautomerase family protein [Nitrososphaeraceae archaeon]